MPGLPYWIQENGSGATIRIIPYALAPTGHSLNGTGGGTSPSTLFQDKIPYFHPPVKDIILDASGFVEYNRNILLLGGEAHAALVGRSLL